MTTWEPDLDFYLDWIDERPALVLVDLEAADHAPVASHPIRIHVRAKLRVVREDGLRDPSELGALGEFEEHVVGALERAVEALYVGRMAHDGYVELYFYAPRASEARLVRLGDLLGDVPTYEPEWYVEDDPDWEFYREALFPDAYARQAMANRARLAELRAAGDRLEVARPVDHRATFEERADAEAAGASLREAGFTLGPREPATDGHHPVSFRRDERLEDDAMDEVCAEVLDVVIEHDGSYEGWRCSVVRP